MRSFIGSQTFSSTLGISLYKWPKAYTSFCISSFFRNFSFFPLNVRVLNLRWYLVHWYNNCYSGRQPFIYFYSFVPLVFIQITSLWKTASINLASHLVRLLSMKRTCLLSHAHVWKSWFWLLIGYQRVTDFAVQDFGLRRSGTPALAVWLPVYSVGVIG